MDSKGKILRCITKDASVLAVVMDSTAIVSEAERIHKTSAESLRPRSAGSSQRLR